MAITAPTTSRRELFGIIATAAAGLSITAPAFAITSRDWDTARAAYLAADQAVNAYSRGQLEPASERYIAWRNQWPLNASRSDFPEMQDGYEAASALYDPIEKHFDALVDARENALEAMMKCPAPHTNAVADKIDALISGQRWECTGFEEVMGDLMADLRRLGGH